MPILLLFLWSACIPLQASITGQLAFIAVLFIEIAFSFIPASFAVFVVKEREINAKHQQVRLLVD